MCNQSANSPTITSDSFDHLYFYSSASSTDHNNIYSYNFNNAESSTDSLTQQYNVSDLNFEEFLKDDDDLYEDDEGEIEYEHGLAMYNPVTEDNVNKINEGVQGQTPQQQQQSQDLEREHLVTLLLKEQERYQKVTEVTREDAQVLEELVVVVEEEGTHAVDIQEKPASNKRKLEDDLAASSSTSTSVSSNKRKKKNQAVFPCPICSKTSKTKYNMETHRLTHDKVRPYHCEACDRWFSRKHDLTRHKNTATHKRKTT